MENSLLNCSVIPLSAYSSHQKRNPFVSQGIPFPNQFGLGAWGRGVGSLRKLWEISFALFGGIRALKSMAAQGHIFLTCNALKYKFVSEGHANYICISKAKQINNYFTTVFKHGNYRN